MNKAIKGFLSVLLAVTVLAALSVSALAVDNSDQYTVTLSRI